MCMGGGGGSPSHGRDFVVVENSCMKTAFSCTLNAIIRGRLCEVAYSNPLLRL